MSQAFWRAHRFSVWIQSEVIGIELGHPEKEKQDENPIISHKVTTVNVDLKH